MPGSRPVLIFLLGVLLATGAIAAESSASRTRVAIRVEDGTVVQSQVVAVGRDVEIRGRVMSNVAVINGTATIDGTVDGDVVAVGGDVVLGPKAAVEGDVFVLGGTLDDSGGGSVKGRSVALPDVSPSWLVLAEGPALGLSSFSPAVLGMKLALLASWMLVAIVLLVVASPGVSSTSRAIAEEPLRSFGTGVVAVLTLFLLVLLFGSLLDALLGVPLVLLVLTAAMVLKLWGVVAVFCWLGGVVAGVVAKRGRRHWQWAVRDTIVGLLALGTLKMLPLVGVWAWTAATLVGMGATLTTKFGSREPWVAE